ncbi:MAG TPA: sugar phosphate nucleotidyltransferase [Terriglobales bacterium]|nr:sugar phosphate nucleotidyltransferase [Terriglobales bacterium]
MLGIVPAAGQAARLQPLGGSKELLPLGLAPAGGEPAGGGLRAVADFLLERMWLAGAERICLVVAADKPDLLRYFGGRGPAGKLFFAVQPRPAGLCDAVFRAAQLVRPDEPVLLGLPDTVWYPRTAFQNGQRDGVHLITFPVAHPEEFDAVEPAGEERVARIEVKRPGDACRRVWGAITAPGRDFLALERLWRRRGAQDQYLGHLLNAWIEAGHPVSFDRQGTHYWDIGTPAGYARALAEAVWLERGGAPRLQLGRSGSGATAPW